MHLHALYLLMPTKPNEVNQIIPILVSRRLRSRYPVVKQLEEKQDSYSSLLDLKLVILNRLYSYVNNIHFTYNRIISIMNIHDP